MMKRILFLTLATILILVGLVWAEWRPKSGIGLGMVLGIGGGGTYTPPAHGDSILMETGSYILMETGDTILKE